MAFSFWQKVGLTAIAVFVTFLIVAVVSIAVIDIVNTESIVVQGSIVETEHYSKVLGGMSSYKYLNVSIMTDNGIEKYTIHLTKDYYDFTMHSEIILEMSKGGMKDYWEINRMIKVPVEGD